jgi:endonuclease I
MKGDLHHLFTCEPKCNSYRGNFPYFDFPENEKPVLADCGRLAQDRFEPNAGKGPVARATLYFLLRYPEVINNRTDRYTAESLVTLQNWHDQHPVTIYERHRNAAIFELQGNRNPLIDLPQLSQSIEFSRGLLTSDIK